MIYLFLSITAILSLYIIVIYIFNKRVIAWKYKALIYGILTFIMLVSTFLTFAHYDKHWEKDNNYSGNSAVGRSAE